MKRFLLENGLSLFFVTILLAALVGQSLAGLADLNSQQVAAGLQTLTYSQYITSSSFAVDVAENWQSEFLQFTLYILATVFLLQHGSSESKEPDQAGLESDEEQQVGEYATSKSLAWARVGGWRLGVYSWSLTAVMTLIFLGSWLAQSIAGRAAYNEQQLEQLQDPLSWHEYVASAEFWSRSLQNWQSEFLAVAAMAVFAIYLRQRGSPESKPVGAAHSSTGAES